MILQHLVLMRKKLHFVDFNNGDY